ncbi:MAG: hypothetical protein SH808_01815 [Saprospiraceae bacterium]|nr:hypothetical protein [Saprospiraceae bacterium]
MKNLPFTLVFTFFLHVALLAQPIMTPDSLTIDAMAKLSPLRASGPEQDGFKSEETDIRLIKTKQSFKK